LAEAVRKFGEQPYMTKSLKRTVAERLRAMVDNADQTVQSDIRIIIERCQ
jgi:hypothetical protein